MAVVQPLAGVHYDPARVGDIGLVLAPPYDVISPAEQIALRARSSYNVIRLILPEEADRGRAAARCLAEWLERGVLVRDPTPAVYLYSQQFVLADGSSHRRDGIICRLQLEDFSRGIVRPHERTLEGPKADRLAILRATGANLSPIFGLYSRPGEPARALAGGDALGEPLFDVGGWHRLWRITDAGVIARVQAALADQMIVIADGHHRYETALAYRDAQPGNEAARFVLAYLANMEEEGVVILPTHRLVCGPLRIGPAALEDRLRELFRVGPLPARPRAAGEIDCVLADRRLRLVARPAAAAHLDAFPPAVRGLDVVRLQGAVLTPLLGVGPEDLEFTHDDGEAIDAVEQGRATAAFLLNPPSMADLRAVCVAGEVMPQKSTYFFPKLASGLVFNLVGPPRV
jgi:uncharacterized protein (DUF1015 family)